MSATPQVINNKGIIKRIKDGVNDYLEHIKLFSKNARLYLIGSLLIGVNFHIFQLLLNLYLRELGFDESSIGVIISSRAVGMTIIAIPAAIVLSRIKLKPIFIVKLYILRSVQLFSFHPTPPTIYLWHFLF